MNPPKSAKVAQNELFGPVLVLYDNHKGLSASSSDAEVLETWVRTVNDGEEPLACYVFTDSQTTKDYCAEHVRCGGMTFNQVKALAVHNITPSPPSRTHHPLTLSSLTAHLHTYTPTHLH